MHAQFMGRSRSTDVITFDHGEILVSADTAERAGRGHGQPCVERELLLYIILPPTARLPPMPSRQAAAVADGKKASCQ
ncbi:MAG: hypothetical protein R3F11_26290 [Verrucomicrobiales bacterium]